MILRPLRLATLLAAGAAPVAAQGVPPLVTDRPDQTESAAIVPRGLFQLEFGGLHARDDDGVGSTRAVNVATALLRVGLVEVLELRLGFAGWTRVAPDGGPTVHGVGDLDVGAKVLVVPGRGSVPAVAVLGAITLPVGHERFRAEGIDPFVKVAVAHDLGGGFSLGYNAGALWTTESTGSGDETLRTDLLYTVVLGRSLSERLGAFLEGYGLLGIQGNRPSWHALDGGFTYQLRPTLQFDASAGIGLSDAAEDWFVGAGVSLRLPR